MPWNVDLLIRYSENLNRVNNLVRVYESHPDSKGKGRKDVQATDVLRASVVLLHSTFEDMCRTIERELLPFASEQVLNEVPLVGIAKHGRPEKFLLGKLVGYRGKTVDEVITRSVAERPHGFFLIVAGAVKIFRVGPDGRERVLHVVEANESFAEAALFMEEYPASAETLAATTVIMVDKAGFKQLLAYDPKLSFKIMGALVRWLSHMRNALTDLTLKEVPARFASYVLSLPAEPTKPIRITISKTTVAQMLGTTKETFSRLLHRLAQHRILLYRGNQVKILNRRRLQQIAAGDEKI